MYCIKVFLKKIKRRKAVSININIYSVYTYIDINFID